MNGARAFIFDSIAQWIAQWSHSGCDARDVYLPRATWDDAFAWRLEGGLGHSFFKREMARQGLKSGTQSKRGQPSSLLKEQQNAVPGGGRGMSDDGVSTRSGDVIEFGEPTFSFGSENFGCVSTCVPIFLLYLL